MAATEVELEPLVQVDGRTNSTAVSGWSVLNCIFSVSCLALPFAFSGAGWVAIPTTALVGLACGFTSCLLQDCCYEECEVTAARYGFPSRLVTILF